MSRFLRFVLAPLGAGLTYRRFVHLLLGAALLLPYLGLVALFVMSVNQGGLDLLGLVILLVPATATAVGVALVPGVRVLEIAAARTLLGATVPDPDPATVDSWPGRRRAAGWLLLNLAVGGFAALVTLTVVPAAVGFLFAPVLDLQPPIPSGPAATWLMPLGVGLPVLLLHAASAAGAALARLAPRVLGPTRTELMSLELERAHAAERALAERTRLARELHDSVGHALTVTTLQAGAAAGKVDSDPAFVSRALDAIAEAGRAALAELDQVLGLLRDGGENGDRQPQPDLACLDALLASTRSAGVHVDVECSGALDAVPPAVSREAYRIVQEGLTNALRHAGPVPVSVRIAAGPEVVELELTNPLAPGSSGARERGGRGLAGMRERVGVLGGELGAGPDEGSWRVTVRLPLGGAGRMSP